MSETDSHLPEFFLKEKGELIIIEILAPLSKPKEGAFLLEKGVFTFDSPPYLLKIKLPFSVLDSFSQVAYNDDTKTYKVKMRKSSECQEDYTNEKGGEILNPVSVKDDEIAVKSTEGKEIQQFYGFGNKYSNMFGSLFNEFSDIISLPNPDSTSIPERRRLRLKEENLKWDECHYLADKEVNAYLRSIFSYMPPWMKSHIKDEIIDDEREMSDRLFDSLKISVLSPENEKISRFQLVDVLFGFAFNKRITEGDNTVESGWTINKLSSTLSWFEVFEDLKAVLVSCYRRSLIFPLYRNWSLAQMVHKDVVNILKLGPKQVVRCLLEVREIFKESENRYILNTLFINDLCNLGYHMSAVHCLELSEEVKKVKIKKSEVISDLPLLEVAAELVLKEETENSNKEELDFSKIIDEMARLNLESENNFSSYSSDTESDTTETDSSQFSDKEN